MKVLIADDNAAWCALLKEEILKSYPNFSVLTAFDGQMAIDIIGQTMPDILILDIIMPHKDGVHVVDHVRTCFTSDYDPIIYILSAMSTQSTVQHLNSCKIDYYSLKPITEETVVFNLTYLLNQRKNKEEIEERIHYSNTNLIKSYILDILISLGLPRHRRCTKCTSEAIMLMFKDQKYLHSLSELYVDTALICKSTPGAVQRNIRYGCQQIIKADTQIYKSLFRSITNITTGSFLLTIYDFVNYKIIR